MLKREARPAAKHGSCQQCPRPRSVSVAAAPSEALILRAAEPRRKACAGTIAGGTPPELSHSGAFPQRFLLLTACAIAAGHERRVGKPLRLRHAC